MEKATDLERPCCSCSAIAWVLEACGLTPTDEGDVSRLYHVAECDGRIVVVLRLVQFCQALLPFLGQPVTSIQRILK